MVKNKKNKYKKGQIPTTLTWFVGFLIIFFVMLMFIFFTLVASKSREIHVQPMEGSSVGSEVQRALVFYLEKNKDKFEGWADSGDRGLEEEITREFLELIEDKDLECFIFQFKDGREIREMDLLGYGGRRHSLSNQASFLEQGSNFVLFTSGGKMIEANIYGGECSLD